MKDISYIMMLTLFLAAGCGKGTSMLKDTTHQRFVVGQQWRYTTRPQEPNSTLTILKIETHPKLDTIVHIAVSDVVIPSPGSDTPRESIGHMPIDASILESSVTQLAQQSVPLPDFAEGYQVWREAFDQGKAGVFSRPVSECVGFMEETLNQGTKQNN
jgi:hypothetical protein